MNIEIKRDDANEKKSVQNIQKVQTHFENSFWITQQNQSNPITRDFIGILSKFDDFECIQFQWVILH